MASKAERIRALVLHDTQFGDPMQAACDYRLPLLRRMDAILAEPDPPDAGARAEHVLKCRPGESPAPEQGVRSVLLRLRAEVDGMCKFRVELADDLLGRNPRVCQTVLLPDTLAIVDRYLAEVE